MRDIIAKLPPETYPLLADYFGSIAADLQRMTNRRSMAEVQLDKFRERSERMKKAASEAAHLATEDGLAQMARAGCAGPMAEFYLTQAQVAHVRAERARRDAEIVRLRTEGVSKAEIARRLKVHVQTVYRVTKGGK